MSHRAEFIGGPKDGHVEYMSRISQCIDFKMRSEYKVSSDSTNRIIFVRYILRDYIPEQHYYRYEFEDYYP